MAYINMVQTLTEFGTKYGLIKESDAEFEKWPNFDLNQRKASFKLLLHLIHLSFDSLVDEAAEGSIKAINDEEEISQSFQRLFKVDPTSENYVPETCAIVPNNDDFVEELESDIIPETQVDDQLSEMKESKRKKKKSPVIIEKKRQKFDDVLITHKEDFGLTARNSDDPMDLKDIAIREKYPELKLEKNSGPSIGLFGCESSTSPSVLSRIRKPKAVEDINDDDDFKPSSASTQLHSSNRLSRSKKPKKSPVSDESSQVYKAHTFKQGSIAKFFKKEPGVPVKNENTDYANQLQVAIKNSLADSSFNDLSINVKEEKKEVKMQLSPVRKAAERKELVGFACKDCERFYAETGVGDKTLNDLLQKCSKHRAHFEPNPESPKNLWNVSMCPDDNKTQAPTTPLKTRKSRLRY